MDHSTEFPAAAAPDNGLSTSPPSKQTGHGTQPNTDGALECGRLTGLVSNHSRHGGTIALTAAKTVIISRKGAKPHPFTGTLLLWSPWLGGQNPKNAGRLGFAAFPAARCRHARNSAQEPNFGA